MVCERVEERTTTYTDRMQKDREVIWLIQFLNDHLEMVLTIINQRVDKLNICHKL
jgi:hypothetical protein